MSSLWPMTQGLAVMSTWWFLGQGVQVPFCTHYQDSVKMYLLLSPSVQPYMNIMFWYSSFIIIEALMTSCKCFFRGHPWCILYLILIRSVLSVLASCTESECFWGNFSAGRVLSKCPWSPCCAVLWGGYEGSSIFNHILFFSAVSLSLPHLKREGFFSLPTYSCPISDVFKEKSFDNSWDFSVSFKNKYQFVIP